MAASALAHAWACHFSGLTAGIFFRRSIAKSGLLFTKSYRIVADADWDKRLLRAGLRAKTLGEITSVFRKDGCNLGMSSAAKEERARLDASAPLYFKALRPVWVLAHRVKRLWSGAHRSEDVAYEVYLPKGDERKAFYANRLRTTRPGRMLNF